MTLSHKRMVLKRIILFLLVCLIFTSYFFLIKKNVLNLDSYYHVGRIKELRYAFIHHELPNFLNFQSFFGVGQAVNALYPDITLWPFVLITLGFSPVHQIVAIKLLIVSLTLITSYLSLYRHNIPTDIALYSSILLTLFSIPNNLGIVSQFTTGVPIIYIFVVPISFIVYDILISNTFDKLLVVKFALIIILIIYSHFLTIVVLGLIMLGIMINNIIMHKFHIASIVNVIVGVILGLVGCIPIIYRYLLFNNIGLVMPYGQGKIITLSHFPFISKINFIVIVFLCLLPYFNFNGIYDNRSNYYQLLAIEIYIYILGSNIFPWWIIQKLPFIKDLQFSDRFQLYVYIIPIILLAQFAKKNLKLGIIFMVLFMIVGLGQIIKDYTSYKGASLTMQSYRAIGKVSSKLTMNEKKFNNGYYYYDYYPSTMPTSYRNYMYVSTKGRKFLLNPQIKGLHNEIKVQKKSINNGIQIKLQHKISDNSGLLILPILGYKGLNYQTFINGRIVPNYIYKMNLAINKHRLNKSDTIIVMYKNPWIYFYMIIISLIYDLYLIGYLKFKAKNQC